MNKLFDWLLQWKTLKKLLSHELYHLFVTSVFVFVAIKIHESKITDITWVTVIILILAFIVLNLFVRAFDFYHNEKKKENQNEIITQFITNKFQVDEAYKISLTEVKKAETKIIIVADYSPPFEPLDPTNERHAYYLEIENKLKSKSGEGFQYIRIMQRDKDNFEKIRTNNGKINRYEWIEGDEQAYAHCKRVLEIKKNNRNLNIKLIVSRNVPSMPSILIVDKHKMLFTIPRREDGPDISTAGVLNFTDTTDDGSALVEKFSNILSTINHESNEALLITEIGGFSEEFTPYELKNAKEKNYPDKIKKIKEDFTKWMTMNS